MGGRKLQVLLVLAIVTVAAMQFAFRRQNAEMTRTIDKAGAQLEDVFGKPAPQKSP